MRTSHMLSWLLIASASLPTAAQPDDASRGQQLYSTHCIGCHTVQMHWRAQKTARDWPTLKAQVRLNDTIYRFPPATTVGQAVPRR